MTAPDELLAEMVGVLPAGVFALDRDGRVVLWNAEAERISGWGRAEVLGRDVFGGPEIPDGDEIPDGGEIPDSGDLPGRRATLDRPTAHRILDELRAGRPFSGRVPATATSGRTLYFRAVPGPGSTIVGVLQDGADTGAQDEAFALLDALWQTAPVGLAYFDTELRYRRVNGAVLAIDGGTTDQRLGRTLEEVHGPVGARIADGLRAVLADGRARPDVPVRGRLWHGRGPLQEWRMYYYPVPGPDARIVGVGVVLVDVTAAEHTRRELAEVAAQRELALNRYQSLVEATSAAVWTRAADGSAEVDAPVLRAITGQTVAEHSGWGFLDVVHPAHRGSLEQEWRASASAERAEVFVRDYRLLTARGGYRWFRTRAVPVHAGGRVVEWVGTEIDIDDAVRSRDRLDILAGATFAMKAALDPEAELTALAEAVVPDFADICRVYLLDPLRLRTGTGGVTGRRSVVRTAPGVTPSPSDADRFVFGADHPIARSARTGAPLLVDTAEIAVPTWRAPSEQAAWGLAIGVHSMLVAPVAARGEVVAALLFIGCGDRSRYTADDLALVGELAERASVAVDAALTFQQSRRVSVALQAAMLTEPPAHPGVEIVARYVPAVAELQVGGDWYDAFPLPGGDLAVGVGDVAGHDLPAAVTMGQLRSMLRGLAYDSDRDARDGTSAPSAVLGRLDRVVCGLAVTRFTTLIYGRVSRAGGRTMFRWSNAGHPVPLLVGPDGEPQRLDGVETVLGADPGCVRHDRAVELVAGSTLLLYTDGLVERRRDPGAESGAALLELVRSGAGLPLAEFCDHLVRGSVADTGDDIVVLALRVEP